METPSSTARRVTRSQTNTLSASNNNNVPFSRKIEDSEKNASKSRQRKGQGQQQQQDRCALIDISNDSPIVGLANGDIETPLSSIAKQRGSRVKKTPGSGEALLRGQVKTLLQKVEEEAEISKLTMDIRPFLQFINSPMQLLAPTPANTPQIPNINNTATGFTEFSPSSVVQEQLISQVCLNQVVIGKNEEHIESEKNVLSPLVLDFSEKSEVTEEDSKMGSTEDDGDSIWSIQVNASTHDEEEEDDEIAEVEEENEEEDYYEEGVEDDGGLLLDELCEGLSNIDVNEGKVVPKFAGKHTRFLYDSEDDEIVEQVVEESADSNSEILHLKGLPTPKGKHIRFSEEEEKSDL
ncbi:Chalcone-flavanone isomerase family protein [Trifolium repens]|nr:Chalcone-flavanone isomerase family protein [Trifolium repens]